MCKLKKCVRILALTTEKKTTPRLEQGFRTLIAMPSTHDERNYIADVVRLWRLERHEQLNRSHEWEKKKGKVGRRKRGDTQELQAKDR